MPEISVTTADREAAQRLVQFIKDQMQPLSVEGRFVLAVEMSRLLKPEIDELNRRVKQAKSLEV